MSLEATRKLILDIWKKARLDIAARRKKERAHGRKTKAKANQAE
jgi:hypothetical protein